MKRTISCLLGLVLCTWVQAGNLEDGLAAARQKDYVRAEQLWLASAADNNLVAMNNLAGMYLTGVLGVPNYKKTHDLLNKASSLGSPEAFVSLGYLYKTGVGVTPDLQKSSEYFKQARELGSVEGKFRYAEGKLKQQNEPEAMQLALRDVEETSKLGYPPALNAVGDMLRLGVFAQRNVERAIQYYEAAAKSGYAESAFALGEIYLNGSGVDSDFSKALTWLKRSSDLGSSESQYLLGYLYSHLSKQKPDELRKAHDYLQAAANNWHEKAQTELARLLFMGIGAPRDLVTAYQWLELAASTGYEEAHYLRAIVALEMTVKEQRQGKENAQKWFEKNHVRPHKHRNDLVILSLR